MGKSGGRRESKEKRIKERRWGDRETVSALSNLSNEEKNGSLSRPDGEAC